MPLFLLTEWKWLLPTIAAGFFAIMWGVTDLRLSHLQTAVAEATTKATEAARAKDAENATLAAALDKSYLERHNAQTEAADAARDVARTRGLYVRAKSSCVPGTATDPSGNSDGTTEVRISDSYADALISIAVDADKAALYAETCHNWAMAVGQK